MEDSAVSFSPSSLPLPPSPAQATPWGTTSQALTFILWHFRLFVRQRCLLEIKVGKSCWEVPLGPVQRWQEGPAKTQTPASFLTPGTRLIPTHKHSPSLSLFPPRWPRRSPEHPMCPLPGVSSGSLGHGVQCSCWIGYSTWESVNL